MAERNGTIIRLVREASGTYDDTSFALESLKKVMEFDETFSEHYYDSKNLTLVAATDFNSGAREMRNFMVFSPSKLLANRDISTIDDFTMLKGLSHMNICTTCLVIVWPWGISLKLLWRKGWLSYVTCTLENMLEFMENVPVWRLWLNFVRRNGFKTTVQRPLSPTWFNWT